MKNEEVQKILEQTKEVYDGIAEKYSEVRNAPWSEMDFLFGKYLMSGDKVLDIGCGNGRFYDSFTANDVDYTGIDNSANLLKIAIKEHPDARFLIASALNLPFSDGVFDAVYSIAVLHHMPSDDLRKDFIEEARRVLKPGGKMVMTVWDMSSKQEKEKKPFNIFGLFAQRLDKGDMFIPWYGAQDCYFHSFKMEEFKSLMEDCGMRIVDSGEISIGKKPYNNLYVVCRKP
jgi:tRNA (uracil-5-)-methyltransferase TRM9